MTDEARTELEPARTATDVLRALRRPHHRGGEGVSKRKVRLPKDKNGTHIDIGDWLMFTDGLLHVAILNYYGAGWWTASDENGEFSDNLGAGVVVTMPKKGKK